MVELQKKVGKYITIEETLDPRDNIKLEGKKRKNRDNTTVNPDQIKSKKDKTPLKGLATPQNASKHALF